MENKKFILILIVGMVFSIILIAFSSKGVYGAQSTPLENPLFHIGDLRYIGGFRIKAGGFGVSSAAWNNGVLGYNPRENSLFIGSHVYQNALGEFSIPPTLVKSNNYTDMPITESPIQNFSFVLNRTDTRNPQNIDRIGGILYKDNQIIVQAYEYYDAPADNTHTTLVIRNASDIKSSDIDGYYEMVGAAHTVLWLSPVPMEWQSFLGGDTIAGASNTFPINSRCSMGPSLFVFNSSDFLNTTQTNGTINTLTLMDFDLNHIFTNNDKGYTPYSEYSEYLEYNYHGTLPPAHEEDTREVYNISLVGNNSYWTEASGAYYGVILPGTRTYAVFGSSGMHYSGGGYKIVQKNGNVCGGPCAYDPDDYYNYYWLFDLKDIMQVKNGTKQPYEVKAYEYGELTLPFDKSYGWSKNHLLGDVAFDEENKILYFSIPGMDKIQSYYEPPPVVLAYTYDLNNSKMCSSLGGICKEDSCIDYTNCTSLSQGVCTSGYCCVGPCFIQQPICGNRVIEEGEQCDDGNTITENCTYGQTSCIVCSSTCQNISGLTSYCGDDLCDALYENSTTCSQDCSSQQHQCTSGADTSHDGKIETSELINYINQWLQGNATINQVVNVIKEWKSGC